MNVWKCRACSYSWEGTESAVEAEKHFQEKKWIYCELTTLEVLETDNLPKSLCSKCTSLLGQFKNFKNTCLQSAEGFHKLTIKQENEEEFAFADAFQYDHKDKSPDVEIKHVVATESDKVSTKRTRRTLEVHLCPVEGCKKQFRNVSLLKSHQQKCHNNDNDKHEDLIKVEVKCLEETESEIIVSSKKATKISGNHLCSEAGCKKRFRKLKLLESHQQIHHGDGKKEQTTRDFVCSFKGCKRCFLTEFNRDSHFQTHENGGKLCCLICRRPFNAYNELKKHMNVHKSKEERKDSFTCSICQRNYSNLASFKAHLQSHEGQQHICATCGKIFDSGVKLRTHRSSHASLEPKECEVCGEIFDSNTKYWRHKVRVHQPKINKMEACIVCGKVALKKDLMKHCRTLHTVYTTTENIYGCHLCDKKFKTPDTLKIHVYKHSNERKHACKLCPKRFTTSALLKKHGYVHSGERPVHCGICNKGFYQKSALDTHMNVHRR